MSRTMTVVLALAWTMAAGVAHAAMQKGDTVQVVTDGSLKSRPMPDAEPLSPAPAGAAATLSVRVSNTSGDWWYVEVDGKKGWLPESALRPAAAATESAPVAEAPAAPPVPAPAAAPMPAAAPAPAPAPESRPVRKAKTEQGSREISLGFDFSKEDSDGYTFETLNLDLRYGYCASDVNEFGAQVSYYKVSVEDESIDSYLIGPFYTHNFASASDDTVPFVGALIATTSTDLGGATFDGHVVEFSGGLRYFAGEDFSMNFTAYHRKSDLEYDDYSLDSTTTGLRVTLSGFLR